MLLADGKLPVSRTWGGTAGAVHLGSNEAFDAVRYLRHIYTYLQFISVFYMLWQVSAAETECYAMANIGQSVSSNGWRQYQTIVDKMVTRRAEVVTAGGNYIPVIGWRLNKVNQQTSSKFLFQLI